MWRILGRGTTDGGLKAGRGTTDGGLMVGTIIKPKLGLQPQPFGEAYHASWQDGDFTKNDAPQGNQPFCQAMHDPQCQHR